jgi:SAM-dependent methyltransferase
MTTTPQRVPVQPETRSRLVRLVYGYMAAQMVHTAVRLGIPDLLDAGPRDSAELAAETGAHQPSLHRLLRALASFGVLTEPEPGRFGLADLAIPLTRHAEDRFSALTRLFCSPEFWRSWTELEHSIRTGGAAFEHVYGVPFFQYLTNTPDLLATFNEAMAENAHFEAPRFVSGYDFGRYDSIVDIGGGNGTLLHAILDAHPAMRGVILETPAVAEQARAATEAAGLSARCEVVAGDFFAAVPAGAQALLLKSVIHNWDDERCVTILRNCRAAVRPDGVLLVLEPVLPARMESATCVETVMSDLNMLTLTSGGFERTEADFHRVLAAGGFALTAISDTIAATDFRVIEARAA